MEEKEEDLYPIEYHYRLWYEEDCNDVFVSCYHSRQDINCEGGVYIAEGIWIYPDGRFENW